MLVSFVQYNDSAIQHITYHNKCTLTIFNFLRDLHTFSRVATPIYISPAVHKGFPFPTSSPTLVVSGVFELVIPTGVR